MEPLKPLPPLEPLPSLNRRRTRRVLSWATALALLSALAAGMMHALGSKLLERAWAYLGWQ